MTGRQSWRWRQGTRRPSLRHAMADRRRWYRIAAAVTAVVGAAALALGASGQLFAPATAPSTTKAVLTQAASAQAVAGSAADDQSRRCARGRRTSRRAPAVRDALSADGDRTTDSLPDGSACGDSGEGHAAR